MLDENQRCIDPLSDWCGLKSVGASGPEPNDDEEGEERGECKRPE
jgi:hypothetical protein